MVQCVSEPHITDEIYPRNEVESLSDQTGSPRDLGRENGWLLGQLDNDSCPFLQNHVPEFHGRYMYFILWRLSYNIPRESVYNSVFDITCVNIIIRPFGFQNDSGMIVRLKAELVIGDPSNLLPVLLLRSWWRGGCLRRGRFNNVLITSIYNIVLSLPCLCLLSICSAWF